MQQWSLFSSHFLNLKTTTRRARSPTLHFPGSVYFLWDRFNWIKKELPNDGRAFLIPWDLLQPVSIKLIEKYGKL